MKNKTEGIELLLFINGWAGLISGTLWMFTAEPGDHWLWFSRFSMGVISLGFYAILKKMDQCGKN